MALRVNTNVPSLFAQKHVSRSGERLSKSFLHLSSGLRINRAADDAAGMGISEKMRSHIRSMKQAMRNTNDGISMIQTAEGSFSEMNNILSRMRELAVQASSEVLQTTERAYIGTEFVALQSEIDRIADATEFNGLKLTNGSVATVDVQVGIKNVAAQDRITVTLQDVNQSALGITTSTVTTAQSAQTTISAIDTAINSLNTSRAALGAAQNRLQSAVTNLAVYHENTVASESAIRDVDFASETAEMTRNSIFQQAGIAVLAQSNRAPEIALQLLQ